MDYFYAAPEQWHAEATVEITGQEALHITRVMRYAVGDIIHVANGRGRIYECSITEIEKKSLTAEVKSFTEQKPCKMKKILVQGMLHFRERFEYAVEKAVELGADEICVFNADHSQRTVVNTERLGLHIIGAFKQSGRYWLPQLIVKNTLEEVLNFYQDCDLIVAHEKTFYDKRPPKLEKDSLLIIGPEGGFSDREVKLLEKKGAKFISLGKNRLRAETAAAAILSQYLYSR